MSGWVISSIIAWNIHAKHGGKKKCRKLLKGYEAAWAQSQGDVPGFAKTEEEKSFTDDLIDWLKFHQCMLIGEIIPYFVR